MRQVLQSLRNGRLEVLDVPCPQARPAHLLIRSHVSLISSGTEKMMREFGKANLLRKTLQQREKTRQVAEKIKTDGLLPAVHAVRSKMDEPLALGYCNVGTVISVGGGVEGFQVGDRVVSNGNHAEVVCVPSNLCAKIPESVPDDEAVFAVLGAIALQGIRLAKPTLGESFAVIGLGLIGLAAVQLLRAHGCRVLGLEFDASRLKLAERFGAQTIDLRGGEDPLAAASEFSRARGLDGVLISASTKSNGPIHQAARACRKRGRIVLVGVAGMQLSRHEFYKKELSFQVSCSYGPGRYDPQYEGLGRDYPLPFVRWTASRNFEAVLDLQAERKLGLATMITHRFPLDRAEQAYEVIERPGGSLGVVLEYPRPLEAALPRLLEQTVRPSAAPAKRTSSPGRPAVGFLGAGNFARRTLIPAFRDCGASLRIVASQRGVSGFHAARKFGFGEATSDSLSVIEHPDVDVVVVATRHDSHAEYVRRALQAGKHVFVEKPLALSDAELEQVTAAYGQLEQQTRAPVLAVGFNRRFAPQVQKIASLLRNAPAPKTFVMTVNAGALPQDHWTRDRREGGGRIIGEACHFIDLLRFLCGYRIVGVQAATISRGDRSPIQEDTVSFTLQFADGSLGTVHYFANGHPAFPKETLDVFCSGRVIRLSNFRKLRAHGWGRFLRMNLWRQDKGHAAEVRAFLAAVSSGAPPPIAFDELVETTRVSFAVLSAAKSGQPVAFPSFGPAPPCHDQTGRQPLRGMA